MNYNNNTLSPWHLTKIYDFTATLNQIVSLSVQDRIRLVQAILESIAAEQVHPDLTEFQKQELDRRIDDFEANPENVLTWEEVKANGVTVVR